MKCPICNAEEHRAIETRTSGDAIRRRRKCDRCRHRWTTFERAEASAAPEIDVDAVKAQVASLQALLGAKA